MRKETQNTDNEMYYCFIECLEILRECSWNTYSDERVIPCVCFVVILWILYHVNTAPQGFLGWPFKCSPFCLICLLFLDSILWIQKHVYSSWIHKSSLTILLLERDKEDKSMDSWKCTVTFLSLRRNKTHALVYLCGRVHSTDVLLF